MKWNITNQYLYGTTENFKFTDKLAMFDLDGTIITTKSGKKFQINENDYKWKYNDVPFKMQNLYKNNYCIIIISNQAGISSGKQSSNEWIAKLDNISSMLNIEMRAFCSTGYNIYRKPSPQFFYEFIPDRDKLDYTNTFFCGDAVGRKHDFSDSDYKFALNCLIKFKTPEYFFLNQIENMPKINYPNILKNININKSTIIDKFKPTKKEMIIMVGYPASGKSTIAKLIKNKYNYKIINQDNLKTISKCKKVAETLLQQNKCIIIDKTNPDRESRKIWIELAIKYAYSIRIIEMTTDIKLAKHNNIYRSYTSNTEKIPELVYNMYKSKYSKPELSEGIEEIIEIECMLSNDLFYYYYLY